VSDPRAFIADAMRALNRSSASAFAHFLSDGVAGALPCWGGLADHFEAIFTTDEDRVAAWDALSVVGERAALLLFLDLNRARPAVLRAVLARASELPATIQVALVTLEGTPEPSAEEARRLHPAARAALADPTARQRERAFYAACARSLRDQRVPVIRKPITEHASVARAP
jgi:hypothetical protein